MTREELVAYCRRAPDLGAVKHEEFVDYITLIERRRRVDNRWITEEAPYMSVDGRLAMANADHRRQDKKLIFHDPVVLSDTDEQLTLMVAVESEIYGRRHGIATSRRLGGSPIEQQHPWEIAETSAIGRALAAMGYGLLPGTGLASAEDMERAAARPAMGSRSRLSERRKLSHRRRPEPARWSKRTYQALEACARSATATPSLSAPPTRVGSCLSSSSARSRLAAPPHSTHPGLAPAGGRGQARIETLFPGAEH